jgi:molybdate transport system substrate-binding protein
MIRPAICLVAASVVFAMPSPTSAETVTVAVAANFLAPLERLEALFEQETGHELVIASGSTGQLYAQIANGAPFDVFLSADSEHPTRLVAEDLGDGTTQFTYAVGKLALWTHSPAKFRPLDLATLRHTDFRWLAIANPELAPYGLAAEQTLK